MPRPLLNSIFRDARRPGAAIACVLLLSATACRERPADTEVVLRVANWGSPAVESDFLRQERQFREQFEVRHPGVRVQIELIPGDGQFAPKLMMMHLAGSAPDVIHLDASSAAIFIDNGVVRDLAPQIAADRDFDIGRYFERAVNIARRGEQLYAIPLDFTPMVMYYNKRLFDATDVPYPHAGWNWEEFLAAAQALTIRNPDGSTQQYGVNFANWMPGWILWLWSGGGDVLEPAGKQARGHLDGPRATAAVQYIVDLIDKHHVAPTLSESAVAGVDLFRAGRAAMDLKGHWMLLDYRADGLDVGVALPPTDGVAPVTVLYEAGLAITTNAHHPDLAWEYIKHMTSADVQMRRVASGLAISANKQVAAHFAGNPVEDAFLKAIEIARPPWGARVERYPYIETLGHEMMEDILSGHVAVPEALNRTTRLIDAVLREQ